MPKASNGASSPLALGNRRGLDGLRHQGAAANELSPGRERRSNVDQLDGVGIIGLVDFLERGEHLIEQLTDRLVSFFDPTFEDRRMTGQGVGDAKEKLIVLAFEFLAEHLQLGDGL
jgi:hypothetical protein